MPRGSHQVKPKASSTTKTLPSVTKPSKTSLLSRAPTFLSRNSSETSLANPTVIQAPDRVPVPQPVPSRSSQVANPNASGDASYFTSKLVRGEQPGLAVKDAGELPTAGGARISSQFVPEDAGAEADLQDALRDLAIGESPPIASPAYSSDSMSIYSTDSGSVFSSASSTYSTATGTSSYSFEENKLESLGEDAEINLNARLPSKTTHQQRGQAVGSRPPTAQENAARAQSSLAKKAAFFKNSRLAPTLPQFRTTLPTWSMICRAAQASLHCYDSQQVTRRGTYTPADTSKNTKAMIVDDQSIDGSRLTVVSIRGTELQSFADWNVNKDAKPVRPAGFLDDEDNACHAGFLQVAQAMVDQIAIQLQQHPSLSERPALLITGHSAGGAVASLLYAHITSTSVTSSLAMLASQFASINCVTFGAPPVSQVPLSRSDFDSGVFLAFANEGDPVLRMSNSAYMKSLAKLMTASPEVVAAPAVKVVRRSRGNAVIRQPVAAVLPPWEERPLWPTPSASLANAGEVILLRGEANGKSTASRVSHEELQDVIFSDLAAHAVDTYIRRVQDAALSAMMGVDVISKPVD